MLEETWDASPGASLDGGDATSFAWTADLSGESPGKGPTSLGILEYAPRARGAHECGPAARKQFDVPHPVDRYVPMESVAGTPWVFTR